MRLERNDAFPTIEIQTVEHGEMRIPEDLTTERAVVLFYRGVW